MLTFQSVNDLRELIEREEFALLSSWRQSTDDAATECVDRAHLGAHHDSNDEEIRDRLGIKHIYHGPTNHHRIENQHHLGRQHVFVDKQAIDQQSHDGRYDTHKCRGCQVENTKVRGQGELVRKGVLLWS